MNFAELSINTDRVFKAAFFAPSSLRASFKGIRRFVALNSMLYKCFYTNKLYILTYILAMHTKSQYRMMLIVACSINANENVLPLA
jgi:hypothetical protein